MLAAVATLALLGERLYPATRMLLMWGLALIMLCQSATILTVNAWMQHPVIAASGAALTRAPTLQQLVRQPHGAVENRTRLQCRARVCSTFICVIAGAYLFRRSHLPVGPGEPAPRSAARRAGHRARRGDRPFQCRSRSPRFQPMKFAAIEGLWKHEAGPAGLIVFARPQSQSQANFSEVKIPYVMSLLAATGCQAARRRESAKKLPLRKSQIRQSIATWPLAPASGSLSGYRELYDRELGACHSNPLSEDLVHRAALRTVPDVPILFGGFHVMVYSGMCLLAIYLLALILRKRILADGHRGLLVLLPGHSAAAVARLHGGLDRRRDGRQPWVVYGFLPTVSGAQLPPLAHGVFGALLVSSLYISLAFLFTCSRCA